MGLQCSSLLSLVPNHRVPPSDFLCVPYAQRPQTPGSWEDNSHTHKSLSQHPTHGRLSPTDLEEQCLLHYAPGRKSSSRVTYLANTSVPSSALLVLLRIFHIWYHTPHQQPMEKLSLTCSHMHIQICSFHTFNLLSFWNKIISKRWNNNHCPFCSQPFAGSYHQKAILLPNYKIYGVSVTSQFQGPLQAPSDGPLHGLTKHRARILRM